MHTVELVRLACRDGMSERAAALHFGISRESVKKMLRFSVPPGYRRTAPVRRPKLDGCCSACNFDPQYQATSIASDFLTSADFE